MSYIGVDLWNIYHHWERKENYPLQDQRIRLSWFNQVMPVHCNFEDKEQDANIYHANSWGSNGCRQSNKKILSPQNNF
jgi:hypothetical protein